MGEDGTGEEKGTFSERPSGWVTHIHFTSVGALQKRCERCATSGLTSRTAHNSLTNIIPPKGGKTYSSFNKSLCNEVQCFLILYVTLSKKNEKRKREEKEEKEKEKRRKKEKKKRKRKRKKKEKRGKL